MSSALFSINDDDGDRGFEAEAEQQLTLRLRQQPPVGVNTVLFQVWNPAGADDTLGIAANPPRASKGAPTLTLSNGSTSGQAVSPGTVDGTVTVTLPEGAHSYLVRCVVNGGYRQLPNGSRVLDPTLIHERGVYVPAAGGLRKPVATEVNQFEVEGWAGAMADVVDASSATGGQLQATGIDGFPPGGTAFQIDAGGDVGFDLRQTNQALYIRMGFNEPAGETYYYAAFEELTMIVRSQLAIAALYNAGGVRLGFFGATAVARPSITGATTQDQVDSLIAALAALGLVTDDR